MDVSGKIAASDAFRTAGNHQLALQHARDALDESQGAPEAREAYCKVLVAMEQFEEVERAALDWLASDPLSLLAHVSLIGALARLNRRAEAEVAFATFISSGIEIDDRIMSLLPSLIETSCASPSAESYARAAEDARLLGDIANAHRLESYAARYRLDMPEAIREGETAHESGYRVPAFLSYLAMIHYRSFHFATARRYAHEALKQQPGMANPTEIMALSRLVMFPPFLLAHFVQRLLLNPALRSWRPIHRSLAAAGIVTCLYFLAAPTIPAIWWMCPFSLAFICYEPFIGALARGLGTEKQAIRLANY